jgi:hypothetical protein
MKQFMKILFYVFSLGCMVVTPAPVSFALVPAGLEPVPAGPAPSSLALELEFAIVRARLRYYLLRFSLFPQCNSYSGMLL